MTPRGRETMLIDCIGTEGKHGSGASFPEQDISIRQRTAWMARIAVVTQSVAIVVGPL
ncbi:hypothetical protein [Nocardia asiatica]